ncbi:TauD/TfdA dioxygenase family protein [Aspergillus puulaauensis]|uniref:TauD/TfdA-like domain-containing protein n=1 Tax=Aspergillus puulaauensis TaxID=1220207 RepID=A0A7R7XWL2_9EURO|nr:uncharacterized protein APUU_61187A [Aspergillus puulaauensis]BCS28139.1 hypothetical protein APUU_61187A [Aspergillus puulaauensis]
MADFQARNHISPDSGFPITLHPNYNPRIKDHVPPESAREPLTPPPDRALFADPDKKSLFSVANRVDLTESIGTVLENVQLSQLTDQQLDELALLVSERGVVFFRKQDLTTEKQVELFQHYGILDRHPAQKDQKFVIIKGSREDHRELLKYTPWPQADFHADTSFEINPPSYSLLRMEEHPPVGGDTAWVSQYGLYDVLSGAMKKFAEGLHAVHTSRLQYDTILDYWQAKTNRAPIDTHHPAVRTHPVTGLKALNVNPGFVTGFAELKKPESDKILDFFAYHIHSGDDHAVRWKWDVGSVAMWDNRCTLHRVIPGSFEGPRRGIRTTVFGEKPYFDANSKGRQE